MRHFVCETPPVIGPTTYPCPKEFVYYRGRCYFANRDTHSYSEAKKSCAFKGSIVAPIKGKGLLHFFKAWAGQAIGGSVWIGIEMDKKQGILNVTDPAKPRISLNVTEGLHFTTGEPFEDSYLAQLEVTRLKGNCFGLEAAVDYEVRGMDCGSKIGSICKWTSKVWS